MGSQQLVIYTIVIIMVVIFITQGYSYYLSYEQNSNRDQLLSQINILINSAKEFQKKHSDLGGGSGVYESWQPNSKLQLAEIGTIRYKIYSNRINFLGVGVIKGQNTDEKVIVHVKLRDDKKTFVNILN
ncbi:MAG: hypothetical protein JEY94_13770 [Melioribacteraceae bacterium]|nr:hypothetical protein [Melioribacteraceae bacterium]